MPDMYSRRFGIRGEKRYIARTLEFMAKKASEKNYDSYFYEMLLRPNEYEADNEDYGLTKCFDSLGETDEARFVSSGGMARRIASVIPYEEAFKEIVKEVPEAEFYAEMYNYGGIQETSSYIEAYYSPAGSPDVSQNFIQICRDPYAEAFEVLDKILSDDWDENSEEDLEENYDDESVDDEEYDDDYDDGEYFLSDEQIAENYKNVLGKPKEYFDAILDEETRPENPDAGILYDIMSYSPDKWENISVKGLKGPETNAIVEGLKAGDRLTLKKSAEYNNIEFFCDKGNVGYTEFSGYYDLIEYFSELADKMPDDVWAEVKSVTPLSQRRRNAKYSLMDVSIVFSDRLLKEIEKMNAKNCSADVKFLDDIFNSIFRQAGFTFDGGAIDDGINDKKYMFSAEQRLENFFNGVPCWYKDTTTGYLELIVCDAENVKDKSFDGMMRVTDNTNTDGSALYAKYWKNSDSLDNLEEDSEKTIARFCKKYKDYRIYGAFGTTGVGENKDRSRKYFYSEAGEEACRMADDPGVLRDGGESLPVPDEVNDTNTAQKTGGISWISIGPRGSVENYDQ